MISNPNVFDVFERQAGAAVDNEDAPGKAAAQLDRVVAVHRDIDTVGDQEPAGLHNHDGDRRCAAGKRNVPTASGNGVGERLGGAAGGSAITDRTGGVYR